MAQFKCGNYWFGGDYYVKSSDECQAGDRFAAGTAVRMRGWGKPEWDPDSKVGCNSRWSGVLFRSATYCEEALNALRSLSETPPGSLTAPGGAQCKQQSIFLGDSSFYDLYHEEGFRCKETVELLNRLAIPSVV